MVKKSSRSRVFAASVAFVVAGGVGVVAAAASSAPPTPSNATSKGVGIGEFGMTAGFYNGHVVNFTYDKGFYCDHGVPSFATSGCEAGSAFRVAPSTNFDPLYITVPLGFTVPGMSMQCPSLLSCVDHPGTIDLSRLAPAVKGLFPNTYSLEQVRAALRNSATSGHEHFITTLNGGQAEWWNVEVVGVTSLSEWNAINAHQSFQYLKQEVTLGRTTPIIASNLFLYFSANS